MSAPFAGLIASVDRRRSRRTAEKLKQDDNDRRRRRESAEQFDEIVLAMKTDWRRCETLLRTMSPEELNAAPSES